MGSAKKSIVLKIALPFLIAIVVLAIFLIKRADTPKETPDLAMPLALTEISIDDISTYGLPVIVDFGADSCIPCKEMAPILAKLNEEMQGKAAIHFIDVWKYPEAAQDFPVQVIPTQVFFTADGKPYVPDEALGIPMTMYSTKDTGEHVFTVHEGGLTEEQMRLILADMGVAE